MKCVRQLEDEYDKYLHIESPVTTVLTLCSWCDVSYKEVEGKPDCPVCLDVVRYCKSLRIKGLKNK